MPDITDETLEAIEAQLGADDGDEVTLFKTKGAKSYSIITEKGKRIPFMQGRFWTSDKEDIEYLQKLADNGECGIYVDPEEPVIDVKNCTPELVARKRHRREIIAALKKANQAVKVNPGNSTQTKSVQHVGEAIDSAAKEAKTVETPVANVVKAQPIAGSGQSAIKAAIAAKEAKGTEDREAEGSGS